MSNGNPGSLLRSKTHLDHEGCLEVRGTVAHWFDRGKNNEILQDLSGIICTISEILPSAYHPPDIVHAALRSSLRVVDLNAVGAAAEIPQRLVPGFLRDNGRVVGIFDLPQKTRPIYEIGQLPVICRPPYRDGIGYLQPKALHCTFGWETSTHQCPICERPDKLELPLSSVRET
ncbi:hypothetical protein KC336_g70 [Hortaea werneckii]|nr:hypothetical protein KC336_g70 [Hortaea werneckii]